MGRMTKFIDSSLCLDDSFLPYNELPVYNIKPAPLHKTCHGYSPLYDLMALQDAYDQLSSIMISNGLTNGSPMLHKPKTTNLNITQTSSGVKVITSDSDAKLDVIDLLKISPEMYRLLENLEVNMEKLSGLNSVQRGDPAANLKSGNAMALVASMAVQFASRLEKSYVKLLENIASAIITNLKIYATTPRIEHIAGEQSQFYARNFKSDDLQQVSRVILQVGSPLQKTLAGRIEIANNLLDKNMIGSVDEYFTVLTTGQLDSLYDNKLSDNYNVRSENQELLEGKIPEVINTDNHPNHLRAHASLLANPEARKDKALTANITEHIARHLEEWKGMDPNLANLLGIPVYTPDAGPLPPEGKIPQGNPEAPEAMMSPADINQKNRIKEIDDAEYLKQQMPVNPLTGEQ